MRSLAVGLLLTLTFFGVPATAVAHKSKAEKSTVPPSCPCGTGEFCVGKRGGTYCKSSSGKKRRQNQPV